MTHLKDSIIQKIHEGEVHMRPRWPFVLRGILVVLVSIIAVGFALFIFSILMIALQENGMTELPAFGFPGLFHFFLNLPWLIILGVFIGLILVELLFRKFSFGYRAPALITLGVIGVGTVLGGLFISSIGPRNFAETVRSNEFVKVQMMREGPQFNKTKPIVHGTIRELNNSDLLVETEEQPVRVLFDESTRFPNGKDVLSVGSSVFVGGMRDGDTMRAFGISKEPPRMKRIKQK